MIYINQMYKKIRLTEKIQVKLVRFFRCQHELSWQRISTNKSTEHFTKEHSEF